MIGYVNLGTNDIDRAARFYDELLVLQQASRVMTTDNFVAWAKKPGDVMLSVIKPFDKNPATVGNGVMVALKVDTPEQVDALYQKALELGAECEGKPGKRSEQFYAAYFRDLDGNKLNAYCFIA